MKRYSPRSLMFQTPSTVDEVRLWPFLSCFASFSIGFSSMDKPAMAESTLVKGTDMMDVELSNGTGTMLEMKNEDGRREDTKCR